MSDPIPSDEDPPSAPPPKKKQYVYGPDNKRKIGFKLKMALIQVIERKQHSDRCDYKSIAIRTGVSVDHLKQLWKQFKEGGIDMGEPSTPEEVQLDARMQHEKSLALLKRYKALLLVDMESSLLAAEDEATKGKRQAWKKYGLPAVAGELKRIIELLRLTETGYNAILDNLAAESARRNAPKNITPDTETRIVHASDEERAMRALENHNGHSVGQTVSE